MYSWEGTREPVWERTAKSAKRLGYTTLCVEDATNNARESTRQQDILETGYDYVLTTEAFLSLAENHKFPL
ncbi:MAG: hypothetical protein ACOX45_09295 [Acutalibacteraceae bacterium]